MTSPMATLLIPTFDRPHFLGKQLAILGKNINQSLVAIKVLDGSLEFMNENRQLCQKMANVEHMPFGDSCDLFTRIAKGFTSVQTEFASLLADDDLLLPAGYLESLAFLRENPDYGAVSARFFRYSWQGEEQAINHGFLYDSVSFDQNAALDRVALFLRNPPGPVCIYALHRATNLRIMAQACLDRMHELDFVTLETAFDILPCALGKVKRLQSPCYGRHFGPSVKHSYPVLNRYESDSNKYSFMKYLFNPKFSSVHAALKAIILGLCADGHYSVSESSDKLDEYFSLYYVSCLIRHDPLFRAIWRKEFGLTPVLID